MWKAAKSLLRYRYGSLRAPKSLLAMGALLAVGAIGLAARQRSNGSE